MFCLRSSPETAQLLVPADPLRSSENSVGAAFGKKMKAYKFRGVSQIPFALDIVFNRRLFCADWKSLNDPVEGTFIHRYESNANVPDRESVQQIILEKEKLKVCSLSSTFDSHLLWAHYASGFSGLAIEVELPDNSPTVKSVKYRGVFEQVTNEDHSSPPATAGRILSSKYDAWKYEKEIRILQRQEWFELNCPVTRIICGHRMNKAMLKALQIIAKSQKIPIHGLMVTEDGLMPYDFSPHTK